MKQTLLAIAFAAFTTTAWASDIDEDYAHAYHNLKGVEAMVLNHLDNPKCYANSTSHSRSELELRATQVLGHVQTALGVLEGLEDGAWATHAHAPEDYLALAADMQHFWGARVYAWPTEDGCHPLAEAPEVELE